MKRKRVEAIIIVTSIIIALIIIGGGLTWKWVSEQDKNINNNNYKPAGTENLTTINNPEPQWLTKLKSGGTITASIIGDGIARSYGCSGPNFTWHYKLTEKFKEAFPNTTINWQVKAVNRSSIQSAISQLEGVPNDTDMLFVFFGRNDVTDLSAEDFKNTYSNLINHIKTNYRAETFLIVESPVTDSTALNWEAKFREFSEIIKEVGKENDLLVIDTYSAFPLDEQNLTPLLTADGVTPSNIGYDLYAAVIFNAISKKYLTTN